MRVFSKTVVSVCLVLMAGLACSNAKPKPIKPPKPVPAGTVLFRFLRNVKGPVDLTIDGVRLPVTRSPKKKFGYLSIAGLSAGKHRYFLSSQQEAFSPDQGEVDLPSDKGVFIVCFAQQFDSVLYGKPEAIPPAQGLPGVVARME